MKKTAFSFLASFILLSSNAFALDLAPFNEQAFAEAQSQGKPVLLQFHKEGCGTCKTQQGVLSKVSPGQVGDLKVFMVKYEGKSETAKKFGVSSPSTLVLVKDSQVKKTIGETDAVKIQEFITQGT